MTPLDQDAYEAGQRAADEIDIDELLERWGPIEPPAPTPLRMWLDGLAPLLLILAACAVAICAAQLVAPTP